MCKNIFLLIEPIEPSEPMLDFSRREKIRASYAFHESRQTH